MTEDSIKELKQEAETFTDSLKKSRATVEACEKSVEGKQREDVLKINELIDSYTSEKENGTIFIPQATEVCTIIKTFTTALKSLKMTLRKSSE